MSAATDSFEPRATLGAGQCIEIAGDDARAFAQAQFSGDVRKLDAGHWQWNAWLDAQGRVRAVMHLADPGDGRLLALLRGGDAQTVCAALQRYVLRARVEPRPLVGLYLSAGVPLPPGELRIDPLSGTGFGYGDRSVWLAASPGRLDGAAELAFRLAAIRAGWPSLPPGEQTFLPPALGLEHLGAVSFDKGCYPGQEIAARLHYRGSHKRRLCHVVSSQYLRQGQPVAAGDWFHGTVLDAVPVTGGCEALAVIDKEIDINNNELHDVLKVVQRFLA